MTKKLCSCGNPSAPSRPTCYKCRSKQIREKDPIAYVYYNLKKSAKKRNYDFTITKEYFREFVLSNELMENRGRHKEAFSVDRIKNELGYIPGNLQVLTKSENILKWHEENRLAHDLENMSLPGENVEHPF